MCDCTCVGYYWKIETGVCSSPASLTSKFQDNQCCIDPLSKKREKKVSANVLSICGRLFVCAIVASSASVQRLGWICMEIFSSARLHIARWVFAALNVVSWRWDGSGLVMSSGRGPESCRRQLQLQGDAVPSSDIYNSACSCPHGHTRFQKQKLLWKMKDFARGLRWLSVKFGLEYLAKIGSPGWGRQCGSRGRAGLWKSAYALYRLCRGIMNDHAIICT